MNWQRVINIFPFVLHILSFFIFNNNSMLYSQVTEGSGKISGTIYNNIGQPLQGVEVRAILSTDTYFDRIVYTSENGSYLIDQLPVGQYYVRISNKLGYLNCYYDNALDKSDATLIKINSNQYVDNIDFYLQRGGFISGQIYDADGNKLTRNASIGFLESDDYSLHGFINSNPDGSYVSPALTNSSYIVKAAAWPSGYVLTYYNNVSTQDSAEVIYVSSQDTVKNIDIYLQKGGAISGYIYSDSDGNQPIKDAWVVVTEWETGEWSSESHSNEEGFYCAPGLRSGAYRVFIFSVDPLKYHNEYYFNTNERNDAQKVYVTVQDTTVGINFRLKPVKKLALSNDYLEMAISDRYPGTSLSLGITGGLPDTHLDDNKPILFGHPNPFTSFTTFLIDGKAVVYGSIDGKFLQDPYYVQDGKSIERIWEYGNIEIKQKVTFVVSEWSETKYEDTALIQYIIRNNDLQGHDIGVRMLFDTMLGKDDAARIRTSDHSYTTCERNYRAPNIPRWWAAMEGNETKTIFSIQGTMTDYGAVTPDRFSIVNWSNIFQTKWDYSTNSELGIIYDSGVAMWWNPATLPSGQERIVCTYLGLGEMFPDTNPPYTDNHVPAKNSVEVSRYTPIQLDIIDSYMGVDSTSVKFWIDDQFVSDFTLSKNDSIFTLHYKPQNPFFFNDTVHVRVEAADLAMQPNYMEPDVYSFEIQKDIVPPYVNYIYPKPFSTNIPPDTSLYFTIADSNSGVDLSSIIVKVNELSVPVDINGDSANYLVNYHFDHLFNEMDSIYVTIYAHDRVRPENELSDSFFFVIARDSLKPYVSNHYPEKNEVDVKLDTTIVVEITDDVAGIDSSSVELTVNNNKVNPVFQGNPLCYRLTYKPENGFFYNEEIHVGINAKDKAKIVNTMDYYAFTFFTEIDTTPPQVQNIMPVPNSLNNNVQSEIVLEIIDDKSGVDPNSIELWVNNIRVSSRISEIEKGYRIQFKKDTAFDFLEWVNVNIKAADLSNPPNPMETFEFKFRIRPEKDETPPYVTMHQPEKGATHVQPDCTLSFHVCDDLSGVDATSISLKLNGSPVIPAINGSLNDFFVSYNLNNIFEYGETINIEIDAKDLAVDSANIMPTEIYSFTIFPDVQPPQVKWIEPNVMDDISLSSQFIFEMSDELTGIDLNSIEILMNGSAIEPSFSGDKWILNAQYIPENKLKYNDTIEFTIKAKDLAMQPNWIKDGKFVFKTITDTDPPYTYDHFPGKNESNVDFRTDIILYIKDDIAGVDKNSIKMKVNGIEVSPQIEGDNAQYQLLYQKENLGYRSGENVQVIVSASDLSNPPNEMPSDSYSFKIKDIYPDLEIVNFSAAPEKILVHKSVQMNASICNHIAPLFDPIDVRLLDNGYAIFDTVISPLDIDESSDFTKVLTFNNKGKHQLKLIVDPEKKIKENDVVNNSAEISVNVIEGELIVRSNPFTPNGDGINDIVAFDFEKLSVQDPELKLYDISGSLIEVLSEYHGFKFQWDGRDRFGNPAQPGVYLYVLQDQNKVVTNGYVVIAR